MRLFVFGLGYSARAVVERLRPRLETVWGTTREAEKVAGIATSGVKPILFDAKCPTLDDPAPNPSPHGGGFKRGQPRGRYTISPCRLLGRTSVITTGTISPIRSACAVTLTGCR